jgi:hypothetical protein
MNTYNPKPIDVSDVELNEDLTELREVIAENVHEIWALQRQQEGSRRKRRQGRIHQLH